MALRVPPLQPWTRPAQALRMLLCGATAPSCLPVALLVGTVLSLVNQGDVVLHGVIGHVLVLKVLANYGIPFLTSSAGALLAVRQHPESRA